MAYVAFLEFIHRFVPLCFVILVLVLQIGANNPVKVSNLGKSTNATQGAIASYEMLGIV